MKRMAREVAMYLKAYNQTGPGLQSASDGLKKFGAGAAKVFAAIAAAGAAAFSAVATGAIAVGASFEQGMANTSSMFITAADSAEQLAGWTEQLSVKARELGATTAFTAREVTEAMYSLASGGMEAGQVIEAVDGVLMLAGATMTDMNTAAETTMKTLKMFNLGADQTNRVVNLFAAGIQNSMLNLERLSFAMQYAAPSASLLDMSIEETTATVAILVDRLGDGSSAGTGFRMMMTKLLKPTDALKKIMGGVTVKVDGFEAVLKKLEDAKILDDPEFITRAFGPRALSAVSALLNVGSAGFAEMARKITDTNAATEMYEHQMKTVKKQLEIVRSAMEETGIAIFDKLHDPLMKIIIWMKDLVEKSRKSFVDIADNAADAFDDITEFVDTKLVPIFEKIKPAAMAILESMSTFADGVKNVIVVAFGEVEEGAIKMGVVLEAVFKSLHEHAETLKVVTGAIVGFAGALTAIGVAAKTIAASFLVLKSASAAIVALKSAGETLVLFAMVNPVLSAIIAAVLAIGTGLGVMVVKMGGFRAAWIKTSAGVKIALESINGELKALWVVILSGKAYTVALGKTIGDVFGRIWTTINGVVSKTGEAFKSLKQMLMNPWDIGDIWDDLQVTLSDGLGDAFRGMKDDIAGYWSEAGAASKIEMDKIVAETAANIARIRNERDAQLAAMGPPPKMQLMPEWDSSIDRTQFHAPIGPMPDGSAMGGLAIGDTGGPQMFGPWPEGALTDAVEDDAENAMTAFEKFTDSLKSTMDSAWSSILDSSMTGGEKWAAIFDNVKNKAWSAIGDMVKKHIWGEKTKTGATQLAEGLQAGAKGAGAVADTVATGVKVTNAGVEAAANTATAASGFFKAFSSIPFIGIGLAIGAIALMMKVLGGIKMAAGGIVNGPGGVDNVPAWLTRDEFVMPVDKTRQYLPILEAMRAGTFDMNSSAPLVSASGGGGPAQVNVSVPITIGPGSLLMADDDLSVKRFAKVIWAEIEDGIQKTYKET